MFILSFLNAAILLEQEFTTNMDREKMSLDPISNSREVTSIVRTDTGGCPRYFVVQDLVKVAVHGVINQFSSLMYSLSHISADSASVKWRSSGIYNFDSCTKNNRKGIDGSKIGRVRYSYPRRTNQS